LAKRYFTRKTLDQIYKENTTMVTKEMMRRFPGLREPVKEIEEEARKVGRQEGRQEGALLTMQKNLLDLLDARLGALDKQTLDTIRSIQDTKALQALFKKALHLKSQEALREAIAAQTTSAKSNGRHNGRHKIGRSK
jgi:hypothetical protein